MFDFRCAYEYPDSECNYFYWIVDQAFGLLEKGEYLEFYAKLKSVHKHTDDNGDYHEDDVWHDYLIGRLSSFDMFFFIEDKLMIIKDYDVFDCEINDNMNKPHGNTWVNLSEVSYIKFPERVYENGNAQSSIP